MLRETITAYGIWWGVTRALKWMLILFWPGLIFMFATAMCGGQPDKWSDGTRITLGIVSLCISVPVYLIYRRGTMPPG